MSMDRSYISENEAQLRRLSEFLDGLSDDQLARPMEAGWTVAAVLGEHGLLGLPDRRAARPLGAGRSPHIAHGRGGGGGLDQRAAKPIFLAIPPSIAARVVLEAAEAADRAVAGMSDELLAKNDETGLIINPARAEHRAEHLDDLERAFSPH
ncbi:MAG: hypothetical protein ACRDHC_04195 [Actinomycetota bacterium]